MIKTLCWDFDGTLAYTMKDFWSNMVYKCACMYGYTGGYELIHSKVNSSKDFSWCDPDTAYPGRTGELWWIDLTQRLTNMLSGCGMEVSSANKAAKALREVALVKENFTLYDDVVEVLKKSKELGYTNILVSNNYPDMDFILSELGIREYFSELFVSAQIGYEKPREEFYHKVLENLNPEECLMIGDNPVADILGAKRMGMSTCFVHKKLETEADYHCLELTEILDVIK